MGKIRIITFNIAHGRGLSFYQGFHRERGIRRNASRIAELFVEARADIVAMQEVDVHSYWNKQVNLLETIQNEAGFPHTAMGANTVRGGHQPLNYGNATLSHYPMVSWENMPFGNATLGEKGFLYTEIKIPDTGELICVVNLHLDFRRAKRLQQMEQLIDWLRDRPHPGFDGRKIAPIVCGDFNCRSSQARDAVQHLFNFLREEDHGHYEIYPENARTFPTYLPTKSIDFILLPEPYRCIHCQVLKANLSDHRPVLLELEY